MTRLEKEISHGRIIANVLFTSFLFLIFVFLSAWILNKYFNLNFWMATTLACWGTSIYNFVFNAKNEVRVKKLRFFTNLAYAIYWGFQIALIVTIHFALYLDFWPTATFVCLCFFANGILAEVEDHLPGGFENPKK
jgi:hypothetical protein